MNRQLTKRSILLTIGVVCFSLGIAIMRIINLGLDPYGAINLGISNTTGLDFGTTIMLFNLAILVLVFFKKRSFIGVGTIIATIPLGYIIQALYELISSMIEIEMSLIIRLVLLTMALLLFAIGIAFTIVADLGIIPYDALSIIIEEVTKGKIKFKWARMGVDGLCTIGALILGGTIGITTFMTVFTLGPFINFFKTKIENTLKL